MFPGTVSVFDNGLTFIHQEIQTTPVVVADVWVRAGVTAEPDSWCGMAHFLEHMIFKGTAKIGPGVFDRLIENNGGVSNAATSYDYAHFSLTTAATNLKQMLPQMGELLLNAAIPDQEFEPERNVVLEEIRQAGDDPDWLGYQHLLESIYAGHPYGRSILGRDRDLMQYSPQDLRCFHRHWYRPENMTVVVVGGVDKTNAEQVVKKAFGQFPEKCLDIPVLPDSHEPVIAGIRRQEIFLPRLESARLILAWVAPGVDSLDTAYGLDLLSVLLADGRTSRLVKDLREEQQLVQGIYSSFSLQKQSSLFTISAWLEPENIERVEELIRHHLEDIATNGVKDKELTRCQRKLCNDYAFSIETPNQIAGLYGYYNTIANLESSFLYPQKIQSFTNRDMQMLAQNFLSPHNYAVTVVYPEV